MTYKIQISTWNLRLGIIYNKDTIKQMLKENIIDVCCMQEVELPHDSSSLPMSLPGF
jgi:exonuclease III